MTKTYSMTSTRLLRQGRPTAITCLVLFLVLSLYAAASYSSPSAEARSGQPKTVAQCKKVYKHNAKARANCIKRVRASSSKCTLVSEWNGPGPLGDIKDFGVKFKWLGNPASSELETAQLEVTVHNPRIVICSAMVSWLSPAGQGEAKPTVGSHGGLSSKVTFPPSAYAPVAKVYARMKQEKGGTR